MKQQTISIPITAQGYCDARQESVHFMLKPADENKGITLRRTDLVDKPKFTLTTEALRESLPELQIPNINLESYLPLIAVLRALGIDNIDIESGCESMPYMGESASVLLFLVESAGIKEQNALRKSIKIPNPITAKLECGKWARLIPSNKQRIAIMNSRAVQGEKILGKDLMINLTPAIFKSELCHVRSNEEIDSDGMNLDSQNQLLLSRLRKEKGLRHLLDAFSLLALLPYPIEADYIGFNASKQENILLLQQVVEQNLFDASENNSEVFDTQKSIAV